MSRNLNNQPLEKGYINYQTGANVNNDNYVRSIGSIKVQPNTEYTISVESSVSQIVVIHYNNGTYKGYSATSTGTFKDFSFTSHSDGNEVRFYFSSTNLNNKVQIEKGTEAHAYTEYAIGNTGLTQIVSDAIDNGYLPKYELDTSVLKNGSGYTVTPIDAHTFKLVGSGSLSVDVYRNTSALPSFMHGGFHVSVKNNNANGSKLQVYGYANGNWTSALFDASNGSAYVTLPNNCSGILIRFQTNGTFDETITYSISSLPSNSDLKQSLSQLDASLTTLTTLSLANGADYESCVQEVFLRNVHIIGRLAMISVSFQAKALQYDSAWKKAFKLPNNLKPIASISEGTITQTNLPVFLSVDTEGNVRFNFYGKNVPTVSLISVNMICII